MIWTTRLLAVIVYFLPSTSKETEPPPYHQKGELALHGRRRYEGSGDGEGCFAQARLHLTGRKEGRKGGGANTWVPVTRNVCLWHQSEHDPGMSPTDGRRQFAQP